jgi:molecular chaperone HtpG
VRQLTKQCAGPLKGEADFKVESIEKADRGTSITLILKDDEQEFANNWRLRSIIKKYSDHIAIPVQMEKIQPPAEEGEEPKADQAPEWEAINDAKALWTKSRSEVSDDEYNEFYRHISHDFA